MTDQEPLPARRTIISMDTVKGLFGRSVVDEIIEIDCSAKKTLRELKIYDEARSVTPDQFDACIQDVALKGIGIIQGKKRIDPMNFLSDDISNKTEN